MNFNFNRIPIFKIFLILSWVGVIASINSSYDDFISLNLNFFDIINFARYLSPIFIFIILLVLLLKNFNKIKFNYLFNFFLLLGLLQFISFFFNGNSILDIGSKWQGDPGYDILLSYFAIIFILIFAYNIELDFKNFYIIFLIILSAVVFSYILAIIKQTIDMGKLTYFYFTFTTSGIIQNNEYGIIGQQNPRSTGLSRQIVIIFSFLFYLMNSLNSKSYRYFLIFVILFILSFFIWGLQSRGSLICWILVWFIFLCFDKKKFVTKIILLLTLFLLPISLFEFSISKQIKINTVKNDSKDLRTNNRIIESDNFTLKLQKKNEITGEITYENKIDYTTGRIFIWKRSFEAFLEKPFLGYGPQGDRAALLKDKTKIDVSERHVWDNNASNGIVYIALSAGILGVVVLLSIYILFLVNIIKSIFLLKIFRSNDFFMKNCISMIVVFTVRSIYENSFTLFSIDYIVVMVSCAYIIKYFEKNNLSTGN